MRASSGECRNSERLPACGYVRVSTSQQAEEGISLEAQKASIEKRCLAQNLDLQHVYLDAGVSGRRGSNRPSLDAAIEHACRCRGVLVVYSLSRLARSLRDLIDISDRLDRKGAQFISLVEQLDTTSATGRFLFHQIAAMAQFESDLIGERVRAAMGHKREQGLAYCRQAPWGYRFVSGRIEEDPGEQRLLRRMRAMQSRGSSIRAIAKKLQREGVTNREGRPIPFQTVGLILKRAAEGENFLTRQRDA